MTQQSEKQPPEVISEEDEPLNDDLSTSEAREPLSKEIDAKQEMEIKRFSLGSNILGWCLVLMFACVAMSMLQPDNSMVSNAFDAFKLIVMTILGYIFGSNSKT